MADPDNILRSYACIAFVIFAYYNLRRARVPFTIRHTYKRLTELFESPPPGWTPPFVPSKAPKAPSLLSAYPKTPRMPGSWPEDDDEAEDSSSSTLQPDLPEPAKGDAPTAPPTTTTSRSAPLAPRLPPSGVIRPPPRPILRNTTEYAGTKSTRAPSKLAIGLAIASRHPIKFGESGSQSMRHRIQGPADDKKSDPAVEATRSSKPAPSTEKERSTAATEVKREKETKFTRLQAKSTISEFQTDMKLTGVYAAPPKTTPTPKIEVAKPVVTELQQVKLPGIWASKWAPDSPSVPSTAAHTAEKVLTSSTPSRAPTSTADFVPAPSSAMVPINVPSTPHTLPGTSGDDSQPTAPIPDPQPPVQRTIEFTSVPISVSAVYIRNEPFAYSDREREILSWLPDKQQEALLQCKTSRTTQDDGNVLCYEDGEVVYFVHILNRIYGCCSRQALLEASTHAAAAAPIVCLPAGSGIRNDTEELQTSIEPAAAEFRNTSIDDAPAPPPASNVPAAVQQIVPTTSQPDVTPTESNSSSPQIGTTPAPPITSFTSNTQPKKASRALKPAMQPLPAVARDTKPLTPSVPLDKVSTNTAPTAGQTRPPSAHQDVNLQPPIFAPGASSNGINGASKPIANAAAPVSSNGIIQPGAFIGPGLGRLDDIKKQDAGLPTASDESEEPLLDQWKKQHEHDAENATPAVPSKSNLPPIATSTDAPPIDVSTTHTQPSSAGATNTDIAPKADSGKIERRKSPFEDISDHEGRLLTHELLNGEKGLLVATRKVRTRYGISPDKEETFEWVNVIGNKMFLQLWEDLFITIGDICDWAVVDDDASDSTNLRDKGKVPDNLLPDLKLYEFNRIVRALVEAAAARGMEDMGSLEDAKQKLDEFSSLFPALNYTKEVNPLLSMDDEDARRQVGRYVGKMRDQAQIVRQACRMSQGMEDKKSWKGHIEIAECMELWRCVKKYSTWIKDWGHGENEGMPDQRDENRASDDFVQGLKLTAWKKEVRDLVRAARDQNFDDCRELEDAYDALRAFLLQFQTDDEFLLDHTG